MDMKNIKYLLVIACVAVVMVTMAIGAGIERERTTPADNISDTETETICKTEAPKSNETTTKEVTEETKQIETTETQTTTTTKEHKTTKDVSKVDNNPIGTPKTEQKTEKQKEQEVKSSYIGSFKVTGYTDEEGFTYGSTTASGVPIGEGMCALNNTQRQELGISYGDKIYIEGLGTYTVVDCGCRYGVVDVWFWMNAEAYAVTGYYDVYYN